MLSAEGRGDSWQWAVGRGEGIVGGGQWAVGRGQLAGKRKGVLSAEGGKKEESWQWAVGREEGIVGGWQLEIGGGVFYRYYRHLS